MKSGPVRLILDAETAQEAAVLAFQWIETRDIFEAWLQFPVPVF